MQEFQNDQVGLTVESWAGRPRTAHGIVAHLTFPPPRVHDCSWHSWLQEGICMLGVKAVVWVSSRDMCGFYHGCSCYQDIQPMHPVMYHLWLIPSPTCFGGVVYFTMLPGIIYSAQHIWMSSFRSSGIEINVCMHLQHNNKQPRTGNCGSLLLHAVVFNIIIL